MTQNQNVNISAWFNNFKNLKWWQGAILLAILLTGLTAIAYEGGNVNVSADLQVQIQQIENQLNIPVNSTLSAFMKSNSYIVSELDQGFCLQNNVGAWLPPFTTNATEVIECGLGNASANGGGSVYVEAGPNLYSASIILPNNTRLIIETGAQGITYTPAAGAYGIVDDFQNWVFTYYSNGVAYDVLNYATATAWLQQMYLSSLSVTSAVTAGSFSSTTYYVNGVNVTGNMLTGGGGSGGAWQGSWNTTVAQLITNSAIAWTQITNANTTVEQLISLYQNFNWQGLWNSTVAQLITNAAIAWGQITNANTTVAQLVALYQNFNWQGAWNTTVSQIVGTAAITWSQITSANATVNQLIANAAISWGQITSANATVNALISTYFNTASIASNLDGPSMIDSLCLQNWVRVANWTCMQDLVPGSTMGEDDVFFKAANGNYYMIFSIGNATTGAYYQQLGIAQVSGPLITSYTYLGVIFDAPNNSYEGNYTTGPTRARCIIYDDISNRYDLFYYSKGTSTSGMCVLVCPAANFPLGPWTEPTGVNPIMSGIHQACIWEEDGVFYAIGDDSSSDYTYWASPYGNQTWQQLATLTHHGNAAITRGLLQLPDGSLLMMQEGSWAGWTQALTTALVDPSRLYIYGNENYSTQFVPTIATEGIEIANGYLYREQGSNIIYCYYDSAYTGGVFVNKCIAYTTLTWKTTFP